MSVSEAAARCSQRALLLHRESKKKRALLGPKRTHTASFACCSRVFLAKNKQEDAIIGFQQQQKSSIRAATLAACCFVRNNSRAQSTMFAGRMIITHQQHQQQQCETKSLQREHKLAIAQNCISLCVNAAVISHSHSN